eukprot:scaffold110694_cov66-Phaeocystis_antarctica.AAC.2
MAARDIDALAPRTISPRTTPSCRAASAAHASDEPHRGTLPAHMPVASKPSAPTTPPSAVMRTRTTSNGLASPAPSPPVIAPAAIFSASEMSPGARPGAIRPRTVGYMPVRMPL